MKRHSILLPALLVGVSFHPSVMAAQSRDPIPTGATSRNCQPSAPPSEDPEPDEIIASGSKLALIQAGVPQAALASFPKGASLLRGGKPVAASKGTVLRQGDVVQNGPGGSLDLRFGDLGTVRMESGARLLLATLFRRGSIPPDGRSTILRLEAGTALLRLRDNRNGNRFVLETPGAHIDAPGTAFQVRVGKTGTQLMVQEGSAAVYLPSGRSTELSVGAREKVLVQKLLPDKPEPCDDGDQSRHDAMRLFAESIDQETEPLLAAIDAQIAGGKYLDAEKQADFVIGRAWGRPNAVRAHARYLDSVRKRLGTVHFAGSELLAFDQTGLAWYRGLDGTQAIGLQAALGDAFRMDPSARRWTLVWSATLHSLSGPVDTMPDRVLQVAESEGSDEIVRTECLALAGLALQDRNERGRTEDLLRQATVLLETVQMDSKCDPVLQMKAIARLLFWPESRLQRTPSQRKLDLDRLLALAQKAPHGWGYYFSAGALQALGRELDAAPYAFLFFDDPLVRTQLADHPGYALPWAEQLANALRAKGEKHHAREIWRLLARRYQHNPQIVERASEELVAIGL